jgi:hypothetical protein
VIGTSNLLGHRDGFGDVPLLRRFVAAAEQDDECSAALHEINAIARTVVDPKLADTVEELRVAKKTGLKPDDPLRDALNRSDVCQASEPALELRGWRTSIMREL